MDCKVSDIAVKVLRIEDGHTSFSIKATVENQSEDEDVNVELQGIDGEGFELGTAWLSGSIPVGMTKTLTTSTLVETSLYEQIAHWQAK